MKHLLFVIGLFLSNSQVSVADMLLLRDNSEPIFGLSASSELLDSQSNIPFSVVDPESGESQIREFARDQIKAIVVTVDHARLRRLKLDRLDEFRDYAEELASHHNDPVAQKLALRLTMLCIYHGAKADSDSLIVRSATKTLVQLAKSPEQLHLYEVTKFLYGGGKPPLSKRINEPTLTPDQERNILPLIQAIRREQFDLGRRLIGSAEFASFQFELRPEIEKAISQERLSIDLRRSLLTEELRIRFNQDLETPEFKTPLISSQNLKSTGKPIILNIAEIAEFDLEATKYRNGNWYRE